MNTNDARQIARAVRLLEARHYDYMQAKRAADAQLTNLRRAEEDVRDARRELDALCALHGVEFADVPEDERAIAGLRCGSAP